MARRTATPEEQPSRDEQPDGAPASSERDDAGLALRLESGVMELGLPLAIGVWAAGLTLAGVVAVILGVAACVSVLRNAEFSGGAKAMWIVAIVLFPIFGSIVYFTVRSDW